MKRIRSSRAIPAGIAGVLSLVVSFTLPLSAFASFNGVLPLTTSGSMPAALAGPVITMSSYDLTEGQTATITYTFPAPPLDFTASDTSATNGVISNLASTTNPDVFTATFTPASTTSATANVISVVGKVTGTNYKDPSFNQPYAVAFDGTNIWVTNSGTNTIDKITPTGTTTAYSGFNGPDGIAFDGTNLWVVNYGAGGQSGLGNTVDKVSLSGSIIASTTVAQAPTAIAFDGSNMWVASYVDGTSPGVVTELASTTATLRTATTSPGPNSIAFDGTNMWTANIGSNNNANGDSVTKISPTGTSTNYVGTGHGTAAIAFDGTNMWTANYGSFTYAGPNFTNLEFDTNGNSVSKITPSGTITTYAGTGDQPYGIAYDGTNMWVTDYEASTTTGDGSVSVVAPNGSIATYTGVGYSPSGIAFDGTNMWVANNNNFAVVGGDTVTKITGVIASSTSANYIVDTIPVSPPSDTGSSGGSSIPQQVNTLNSSGGNKVARSLIQEFPNLFPGLTASTTSALAKTTTTSTAVNSSGISATIIGGAAKIKVTQSYKSHNNSVKIIQKLLAADSSLNYTAGVTGYYGRTTQKAVEAFQVAHGVVKPGRAGYGSVGPKTRLAMIQVYGE